MRKIRSILIIGAFLFSLMQLNAQTYKRIVSLASSLTEHLKLLNAEHKLVGITNYCVVESDINVVASAVDINLERIVAVDPDLVLATSLTSTETLDLMKKIGLNVVFFKLPKSLNDINEQFIQIGELIGETDKAKAIVDNVNDRVKIARSKVQKSHIKVFMEIGTNPLFCVIPNTFLNDYITFAGCENIAKDLTNGAISRESVIISDPDVIFIVTMGTLGEEETRLWESYSHLSAVQKDQVFVINSEKACSPTPVNFIETLEEVIAKIYKK